MTQGSTPPIVNQLPHSSTSHQFPSHLICTPARINVVMKECGLRTGNRVGNKWLRVVVKQQVIYS